MTAIAQAIDLAGYGEFPSSYVHEERTVVAGRPLPVAGGVLKWYDVHRDGRPIPESEIAAARAFVQAEAGAGRFEADYGFGHVIHHQSGGGTFLLVGFWRGHNELWETVYTRSTADPTAAWEPESGTRVHPVACVWEMTPIWHERNAWTRFLFSARDAAAKMAYLADVMNGST
jgi:hypothetical protein